MLVLFASNTLKTTATPELNPPGPNTRLLDCSGITVFWHPSVLASQCSGISAQTSLSLLKHDLVMAINICHHAHFPYRGGSPGDENRLHCLRRGLDRLTLEFAQLIETSSVSRHANTAHSCLKASIGFIWAAFLAG